MTAKRETADFQGLSVYSGKNGRRKIGRVLRAVFYPDGLHLAGYLVKRPDLLMMIRRADTFFAWDRFMVVGKKVIVADHKESWGDRACQRLGVDWDRAMIITGMSVLDSEGKTIGQVGSVEYDEQTGAVMAFSVSTDVGTRVLLGQIRIPVGSIWKYENQQLILSPAAVVSEAEGGLAARAGQQAAVVADLVKTKAKAAATVAGEVAGNVNAYRGAKILGRQIGRTKGMFKAFREEYKKASKN